jgi:hypothetical protein
MVDGNEQTGYILASDANGTASWTDPSSLTESTFSVINNIVLPNTNFIDETTDDFVFGSTQLDDDANTDHDNRFFFDKSKAAFRADSAMSSEWNDANIGLHSIALGFSTKASAEGAIALSSFAEATGKYSFAAGYGTRASGLESIAMGNGSIASGPGTSAIGYSATAEGDYATAIGYWNYTKGDNSFSIGNSNDVHGDYSGTIGNSNDVSAQYSFAFGNNSTTYNQYTFSMGNDLTPSSAYETVVGRFNTSATGSYSSWVSTDRLFVIGNGTASGARSDALVVYKDGDATLTGVLTQSSDARLKTNIKQLSSSLNKIEQLSGYSYNWIDTTARSKDIQIGLIAQEVEALYPELVRKDGNGYLSVNYSGLVPVLIEATKEQQATINAQKSKIQSLENRLIEVEKFISILKK